MAHTFVHFVLNGAFGLDPTAKLILVILAEAANKDSGGVAYPGVETIARRAGVDTRQVQRTLRWLVEKGWLEPIGRTTGGRRPDGGGHATRYRINLNRMTEASAKGDAGATLATGVKGDTDATLGDDPRVTSKAAKGDTQGVKGDTQGTLRVTPTPPEPEVEPFINRKLNHRNTTAGATSTESQNPFRKSSNTEPEQGNDSAPKASHEVSADGKDEHRLPNNTPVILLKPAKTEDERIAAIEANREWQLAEVKRLTAKGT